VQIRFCQAEEFFDLLNINDWETTLKTTFQNETLAILIETEEHKHDPRKKTVTDLTLTK
jgi:hypothetical protein